MQVPTYWEWESTSATNSSSSSSSSSAGSNANNNDSNGRSIETETETSTMELRVQVQSLDNSAMGSPLLVAVENFLSPAECEHLIDLARERLQRSHVVGNAASSDTSSGSGSSGSSSPVAPKTAQATAFPTEASMAVGSRSSSSCWLSAGKSPVLERIRARAAALLGLPIATFAPHTEDMQV